MRTTRISILAAIAGAAAVGLAAPASADLTDGNYQANYENSNSSHPWVVTSCGAGCKSVQWDSGDRTGTDTYHLNGNIWTAERSDFTKTIDNNTLLATMEGDVNGQHLVQRTQLVKNG